MTKNLQDDLSRLERRIVDALYRMGKGSVADVVREIGDDDVHNSIRVTMSNLEKKGILKHDREGVRNIYEPVIREDRARKSAMDHLMRTFFHGSPVNAMLGFLDRSEKKLSPETIAEIRAMIDEAQHPTKYR